MDKLLRVGEGKMLRRLKGIADQVTSIEEDFTTMSDDELRSQTADYRARIEKGESLDRLLPEAFATVREASHRVLGKRHYDVQIMGGAALHLGNIAEMKTGEGKTLVATLPSYLNALTGKGVHVITVNDYLAKFQSEQMGRVHHFLGLETAVILSGQSPAERRRAYAADITYGTNNEFGFDYLRDNMALRLEDCVQRGHHFAIVDEVDSILVDEARTPLIISGPAEESHEWYPEFAKIAGRMQRDVHYEVDEKKRTVSVIEAGIDFVEDRLGISNLYESANTPLISHLNQAIKAKELFKKDRDYVLMDGEVLIVDEHTGRTLVGRRYNEGLHQAIEAKEKVQIKDEYQTLATITLQNFFRMYDKLSGMTGTALTEAAEFQKIYGLGVVPIPTNKPMVRDDEKDLIYRTEDAKFAAIVSDVAERHEKGQPVLIGTASVAKSELLSRALKEAGVRHEVLNAKNHAREAAIVAEAGRRGAVTVATNMAGRGTDIILGGNSEFLADQQLRARGLDPVEHAEEYEAAWGEALESIETEVRAEHEEVVALGGLYVVGSERHESRRIDNQLRGRSGRQGDPGESRFYLSLGDDLMRLFKSDVVEWVLQALKIPDDQPIENKRVSASIASAQAQVEAQNFETRKNILKYDDVMNRQRHAIYGDRRKVLEGADVEAQLRSATASVVESYVRSGTEGFVEDWDLEQLWTQVSTLYPVTLDRAEYEGVDLTVEELVKDFVEDASRAYDAREESLGAPAMRELERQVLLTVLDRKWREHLYEMDYLREGIGLRAMAQRDPLVEYQREGGTMFNSMMAAFTEEVVGYLFNLDVTVRPAAGPAVGAVRDGRAITVDDVGAAIAPAAPAGAAGGAPAPVGDAAAGTDGQQDGAAGGAAASGTAGDPDQGDPEPEDAGPAEHEAARPVVQAKGLGGSSQRRLTYSAPDETGRATATATQEPADSYAGVGRNDVCPCGSGRKFKQCHGRKS
ncbi:protein translocase subunit secA [Auraticoccus monumenti]|uniref:Protein translocase subunit SecA n=1 Tax=Auraticoccus monumenti TaxID=675864 RepID=A0A1G7E1T5_9ACTN|nr:preprotein translocase subunit SecA [Auraticoccus monumenti]SDE57592.1 protein translocase subunit secA [Auraticoccus monumenti]